MTESASTAAWSAWSAALDGLEASVIATEELLRSRLQQAEPEPWSPPGGIGPIPPGLVARARALAERQQTVLAQLPGAVETAQRQWELTRKITGATIPRHGSIYIDTTA